MQSQYKKGIIGTSLEDLFSTRRTRVLHQIYISGVDLPGPHTAQRLGRHTCRPKGQVLNVTFPIGGGREAGGWGRGGGSTLGGATIGSFIMATGSPR